MHKTKKTILTALAVILLLAATPGFAQLAGTWAGTGRGDCYPRPGVVIYPWQEWKGFIPNSEDVFSGEWWDADGNHGTFKGTPVPSPIPEERRFEGKWTWYDPLSPTPDPVVGGKFKMTFYFLDGWCEGNWTSIWPSTSTACTMKGEKVD